MSNRAGRSLFLSFCARSFPKQMWKVTKAFKVNIKWEKGSRPTIEVKLQPETVLEYRHSAFL